MVEIFDLGKRRADDFERLMKRRSELERMIHNCLVMMNSTIDIIDLKRMEFSRMVESYLKDWRKELESINIKLAKI